MIRNHRLWKISILWQKLTASFLLFLSIITPAGSAIAENAPQVLNPTFTYQSNKPEVDKSTGALTQSVKLTIPQGRNGLQPDLSLIYNSQRLEDGIFGYGWNINIPYIERINRRGTNNLYTDDYFYSSLGGELASTTESGQYRPRVEEGSFLTYTLSATSTGGQWVVYDRRGTKYTFGTSTGSQIYDSNDTTKVFRWMLEEVRDTNNNFIRYEYYKDGGQIYPSKIYYTGNGGTDGIFLIEFTRESRSDILTSYKTAFSVATNYRISEIQAKVNGTWVRKYELDYTTGNNGYRSLLSSILETGQDEAGATTLSLPAMTFEYSSTSVSFTDYDSSLMEQIYSSAYVIADTDGNGTLDINSSTGSTVNWFHLNYTEGNISSTTFSNPPRYEEAWASVGDTNKTPIEVGTRYLDFNGDGLADVLRAAFNSYVTPNQDIRRLYLNNGDLTWSSTTGTSTFPHFSRYTPDGEITEGLFGNLNGDGLVDFQRASSYGPENNDPFFGTGSSFVSGSGFDPLAVLPPPVTADTHDSRLVDINADGLDDWVHNDSGTMKVCFNTGLNWETSCNSSYNVSTTTTDSQGRDKGIRFMDINGDGLVDWVKSYTMPANTSGMDVGDFNIVKLNTGLGWATSSINLPGYIATGQVTGDTFTGFSYKEMWDWSADGAVDWHKKKNNAGGQDMLKRINYPSGGNTQVGYTPTGAQLSDNVPKHKNLPASIYTVASTTANDGFGNTESINYSYWDGDLYFANSYDRKIAGFEQIRETRNDSLITTFYSQGNVSSTTVGEFVDHYAKIGKPYKEEVKDPSNGNLYRRTFYGWNILNQGTNRDFIYLASTTEITFDGDSDHKDRSTTYTYDTSGNLIQKIDWGEVTADTGTGIFTDIGSDLASTTISYVASTTVNLSLPKQEIVQDQSSNKMREILYYFDSLAHGSIGKGNQTRVEKWISGSSYASTTKSYDGTYGLVTSETDPKGKTTSYTIDSYNLKVATTTNALSQTTGYQYDLSSGKVKQLTDQNNRVFTFTFDALDRLTEEKQPDISSPSTSVTKTAYAYSTNVFPQKIQKTSYLNSATSSDTYTYFDGRGRKIQERKEAEGDSTYSVKDHIYGNGGKITRETLPYFASSTSWATSTAVNGISTNYRYDPMDRITDIGTVVGTTTNAYDDWKTTVTDPLSRVKDYIRDAYTNLTSVVERISGVYATTTYEYNRRNDLTKVTDSLANIRNFTYDGLSRRLTAEDLHASGDGTYGTWTYTYDDAGNTTSQVDPKSQTVNYTYDDINRVLTENYTGLAGTEIEYLYDSCSDGVGRLCSATTTDVVTTKTYNPLGLPSSESKRIASTTFATSYSYDRQGNITLITHPDSSQVQNIYNDAGLLEKIQYRTSDSAAYSNIVTDINYSPIEQESYLAYANNSKICNSYSQSQLYRLTAKRTTSFGYGCQSAPWPGYATSSNTISQIHLLQDLSYTYDAIGNITTLSDAGLAGISRTMSYTYDDLYRLAYASTTAAASNPYRYSFEYDLLGNITRRTDGITSSPNTHSLDLERSSNQYAYVANNLGISTNSSPMTVEAWIKPESHPAGVRYSITGQGSATSKNYHWLEYADLGGGTYGFRYQIDKNGVSASSIQYDITLATSTWTHVVTTYDSSGNFKLYTASPGSAHTLRASSSITPGNGSSYVNDIFVVGAEMEYDTIPNSTQRFDGLIDEVRVWNTVRTTTQMDANMETELQGNESGLAAYYTLDNSYNDAGSGAYHLTASSSPVFSVDAPFAGGGNSSATTYAYAGTDYANPHAPTGINTGSGTTTYAYDNNGNLTSHGTTTHSFDYKNRITQTGSGTATSTYTYDNTTARMSQTRSSAVTFYPNQYFLSASSTLTGYAATSTVNIFAGGKLVATVDRYGTSTNPTISYHSADHLSSASVITDSNGLLSRALDYYPFGGLRVSTSTLQITETASTTQTTNTHSIDLERTNSHYAYIENNLGITSYSTPITIEAWIKPESQPSSIRYSIAGQGNNTSKVYYWLEYMDNGGGDYVLRFSVDRNGVAGYNTVYHTTLSTTDWTHVVAAFDGSGTIKIYTASTTGTHIERASTAITPGNGSSFVNNVFTVGSEMEWDTIPNSAHRFDGLIDEVRVWNGAYILERRVVSEFEGWSREQLVNYLLDKLTGIPNNLIR